MNTFKCPRCNDTIPAKYLYNHFKDHVGDLEFKESTLCLYCNTRQLRSVFKEHLVSVHFNEVLQKPDKAELAIIGCPICEHKFPIRKVVEHLKKSHNIYKEHDILCPVCFKYIELRAFKMHTRQHRVSSYNDIKTPIKLRASQNEREPFGLASEFTISDSKLLNKKNGFKKHIKGKIISTPMRD